LNYYSEYLGILPIGLEVDFFV